MSWRDGGIVTSRFDIDFRWLASDLPDERERSTLGEITITANGFCATEAEDIPARTIRSSSRLPAVRLAEWLAHNWWRILWEPHTDSPSWRYSHRVANAGGGYVWPDLTFSSDWNSVQVQCQPTARHETALVRYTNSFTTRVPSAVFIRAIDSFLEGVTGRLVLTSKEESGLSVLWADLMQERQDPDIAWWRQLEAAMGYDPDVAPEPLLTAIGTLMDHYGPDPVREVAAFSRDQTVSHLQELRKDADSNGAAVHVSRCSTIREQLTAQLGEHDVDWERAAKAARIVHQAWGVKTPVTTLMLSQIFEVPEGLIQDSPAASTSPVAAGFRDQDNPDQFQFSWNRKHPTSRRFALARLVADHIVAPETELLLPSTDAATARQRFQRAFAQEFLCSFTDLMEYLQTARPDSDAIERAADHFDVSRQLVSTTLVNKGILGRESLTEWVA